MANGFYVFNFEGKTQFSINCSGKKFFMKITDKDRERRLTSKEEFFAKYSSLYEEFKSSPRKFFDSSLPLTCCFIDPDDAHLMPQYKAEMS